MVLKNNVGQNFIYRCSNVGQNFIYRCSNGTLEQRGAKLYLLLFKWYLRTTWGKTLFTAVQMVL